MLPSKPCPIQVHYLWFPASLNNNFIDYMILDDYIVTKENEKYFYKDNSQNLLSPKNKPVFYGSSFIDHEYFKKNINNNDLLMIKGSNATGLNKFSKSIKSGQINVI